MSKLIFVVYFILLLCGVISANYEYICTEGLLKKPYLKIYNTRLGDIIHDYAPGFYDVSHLNNIYVCTNGPVVLYFTRESVAGDVYDEARNTLDVHKCQYYNGIPGPGSNKRPDHLKAVLLIGNEHDYRLPLVKTFTAPSLIDENSGSYKNVTSIITIGAQNCKIYKGLLKQEIKFNLETTAETQMCRLAYQTMGKWVDGDAGEVESVKEILTTENGVTEGECLKTVTPGAAVIQSFKANERVMQTHLDVFKEFKEPPDKKSDIEKLKATIALKKSDILGSKDASKKEQLEKELEENEKELSYLEVEQLHSDIYSQTKSIVEDKKFDDATKILNQIDIDSLETAKKDKQRLQEEYNALDPSETERMTALFKEFRESAQLTKTLQTQVDDSFAMALPIMDSVENKLKQAEILLKVLPQIAKEAEVALAGKSSGKRFSSPKLSKIKLTAESVPKTVLVKIPEPPKESDPPPDAKNPNALVDTNSASSEICLELPSVGTTKYRPDEKEIGACVSEKGTKLFGCQLLKARLGQPGICAFEEADTDNEQEPTKPIPVANPATHYLPQHMVDVIKLINEIYKKACDRIRPVFAERINNLLQCYLIKDRVKKSQDANEGATIPSRVKFWSKIIGALEECRDQGHAMKFARESVDVDKYYLKKDGDYIPIPFLKEQAENEYGFNFAIDMSWKVFATVLGLCMPSYESKIPLITTRFFTMYTEEFLQPIQETWISEKDNNVFKRIMSYYYGIGGYETWVSYCMEASFLYSSDVSFRPPRKLLVNSNTESNYFVKDIIPEAAKRRSLSFQSDERTLKR